MSDTPTTNNTSPADLARKFHEVYERLAPTFLYETREDTRTFDPNSPNGLLMIAVCAEVLDALAEAGQGEPVEDVAADVYEQLADMIAPHVTETPNGLPGSVVGSFAVLLDHWLSTRPAAAVEKPAEPRRRRGHFYPGFTAEESHAENVRVYGKDALSDEELRADRLCQDEPGSGAQGLSRALASKPDARRVVREGWKLVPVEPTFEMKVAGDKAGWWCADKYRAMLAAAPEAPEVRKQMTPRERQAAWAKYEPKRSRGRPNSFGHPDAGKGVLDYDFGFSDGIKAAEEFHGITDSEGK